MHHLIELDLFENKTSVFGSSECIQPATTLEAHLYSFSVATQYVGDEALEKSALEVGSCSTTLAGCSQDSLFLVDRQPDYSSEQVQPADSSPETYYIGEHPRVSKKRCADDIEMVSSDMEAMLERIAKMAVEKAAERTEAAVETVARKLDETAAIARAAQQIPSAALDLAKANQTDYNSFVEGRGGRGCFATDAD